MIDPNASANPVSRRTKEKYMDEGGYGRERVVQVLAGGLTIRAELAARAMQSLIGGSLYCTYSDSAIAGLAVKYADALIAELNKGECLC